MLQRRLENKPSVLWCVPSIVCIVLMGLCWIALALILSNTQKAQIAAEARHLHNVGMIFAEHAGSTIGQADAVLRSLQSDVEAELSDAGNELVGKAKYGLEAVARPIECLVLIDPAGNLVSSSAHKDSPDADVMEKEMIRRLSAGGDTSLHIGEPVVSKLTSRWSLYLSRRIKAPGGAVAGIVGARLDLEVLSAMYGTVTIGEDSIVMLVGDDGMVMAKIGGDGATIGERLDSPEWQRLLQQPLSRPIVSPTLMSSEKMIDVVRVAGYPLRIVVGLSKDDYLAAYYLAERRLVSIGALATVFLALIAGLFAALQLRSNAAFQSLVSAEQNNRLINTTLAVNNDRFQSMAEHLRIGLCMFDGAGNLVVCNDNFLKMYDLPVEIRSREASLREVVLMCVDNGHWALRSDDENSDNSEPIYWGRANEEANRKVYDLIDGRSILVTRQGMNTGGWVFTHEDITERRKKDRQIEMLALSDSLTLLANRARLLRELESGVAASEKNFALLLLDLDHFKSVNDSLGHPVGDKLLIEVAERIKRTCRDIDLVARLGGDEFAIIARDLSSTQDARRLAARLIYEVSQPYVVVGHELVVGVSVGIALSHRYGATPEGLMQDADVALYRAKAEGRNSYRVFAQEMMIQIKERRSLEMELRTAVAENQIEAYFQPIAQTACGSAVGFEALARWNHPEKGLIMPSDFIEAAEETGLISTIGVQLLRQACLAMQMVSPETFLSINISPVQLRQNDFVERVLRVLEEEKLSPDRLQIEITEAVVLRDDAVTQHNLLALRHSGMRIAVDDFGLGYSSLSYLKEYPFDTVKIDRSFTGGVTDNGRGLAIVKAIVDLARAIGMDVTAEGVETEEQYLQLKKIGCGKVQGFLFGRPIPAREAFRKGTLAFPEKASDERSRQYCA